MKIIVICIIILFTSTYSAATIGIISGSSAEFLYNVLPKKSESIVSITEITRNAGDSIHCTQFIDETKNSIYECQLEGSLYKNINILDDEEPDGKFYIHCQNSAKIFFESLSDCIEPSWSDEYGIKNDHSESDDTEKCFFYPVDRPNAASLRNETSTLTGEYAVSLRNETSTLTGEYAVKNDHTDECQNPNKCSCFEIVSTEEEEQYINYISVKRIHRTSFFSSNFNYEKQYKTEKERASYQFIWTSPIILKPIRTKKAAK